MQSRTERVFEFQAALVVPDTAQMSLSFADHPENHQHYLIIQRDEELRNAILPDLENIYLERDDQIFGGYGGIESVTLSRHRLSLKLTPRMAKRMGNFDELILGFEQADNSFRHIEELVALIFRGYESRIKHKQ
jgi:hypothetical protein